MVFGQIGAFILSFILTLVGIPLFVKFSKREHIGGQQMHEDVKQHAAKAGTPTMGGVVFVAVSLIVSLVLALLLNRLDPSFIVIALVFAIYAVVGFLDDFLKIFKKQNQGLRAWQKFLAQILTGIIVWVIFIGRRPDVINFFGFNLHLSFPFLFPIFLIFWLVGWSNAVNLTDGLDGLATISVTISLVAYAVIAVFNQQYDVLLIILATVGSLLAFFIFNKKPAMIFMGDVGSLALGSLLAIISVVLHAEWTLLFIGIIYVIETLSIMMQVSYFKLTHGKRIFAMTPIHHHFELGGWTGKGEGWDEWKIDYLFWGITAGVSLVTVILSIIF